MSQDEIKLQAILRELTRVRRKIKDLKEIENDLRSNDVYKRYIEKKLDELEVTYY